jgi:hypothetical protein
MKLMFFHIYLMSFEGMLSYDLVSVLHIFHAWGTILIERMDRYELQWRQEP